MAQGRKFTRYHLASRQRASHTAPFPASRKFRQWPGISSSPQSPSAFAGAPFLGRRIKTTLRRNNGRTRELLPIEAPAPGPCSSAFSVPTLTKRGSLTGQSQITLPFAAFLKYLSHYSPKYPYLSTQKVNYRIIRIKKDGPKAIFFIFHDLSAGLRWCSSQKSR